MRLICLLTLNRRFLPAQFSFPAKTGNSGSNSRTISALAILSAEMPRISGSVCNCDTAICPGAFGNRLKRKTRFPPGVFPIMRLQPVAAKNHENQQANASNLLTQMARVAPAAALFGEFVGGCRASPEQNAARLKSCPFKTRCFNRSFRQDSSAGFFRFVVSHPFAGKKAKGRGTGLPVALCARLKSRPVTKPPRLHSGWRSSANCSPP